MAEKKQPSIAPAEQMQQQGQGEEYNAFGFPNSNPILSQYLMNPYFYQAGVFAPQVQGSNISVSDQEWADYVNLMKLSGHETPQQRQQYYPPQYGYYSNEGNSFSNNAREIPAYSTITPPTQRAPQYFSGLTFNNPFTNSYGIPPLGYHQPFNPLAQSIAPFGAAAIQQQQQQAKLNGTAAASASAQNVNMFNSSLDHRQQDHIFNRMVAANATNEHQSASSQHTLDYRASQQQQHQQHHKSAKGGQKQQQQQQQQQQMFDETVQGIAGLNVAGDDIVQQQTDKEHANEAPKRKTWAEALKSQPKPQKQSAKAGKGSKGAAEHTGSSSTPSTSTSSLKPATAAPSQPKTVQASSNIIRSAPAPMTTASSTSAAAAKIAKSPKFADINPRTFDCNPKFARFFVIKSYSEYDVHKAIKYDVWASTENGNRRLDAAYRDSSAFPIYLFYSVNGSGQFCGMAQMTSGVDFSKKLDYWADDKWSGQFTVKWIFIKDIPNTQFRHIILENNENKPVTKSRDTQEVPLEQGKEMLRIFTNFRAKLSILDDFDYYDDQEEKKKLAAPSSAPATASSATDTNQYHHSHQQGPSGASSTHSANTSRTATAGGARSASSADHASSNGSGKSTSANNTNSGAQQLQQQLQQQPPRAARRQQPQQSSTGSGASSARGASK